MNGKGDARRPAAVSEAEVEAAWVRIFRTPTTDLGSELIRSMHTVAVEQTGTRGLVRSRRAVTITECSRSATSTPAPEA